MSRNGRGALVNGAWSICFALVDAAMTERIERVEGGKTRARLYSRLSCYPWVSFRRDGNGEHGPQRSNR